MSTLSTLVLLGGGCWVCWILGGATCDLGRCSCGSCGCGLLGCCWGRGFLSLGWFFVAALLVLDEDLAHELRWAGDLLAWLQLDFRHK